MFCSSSASVHGRIWCWKWPPCEHRPRWAGSTCSPFLRGKQGVEVTQSPPGVERPRDGRRPNAPASTDGLAADWRRSKEDHSSQCANTSDFASFCVRLIGSRISKCMRSDYTVCATCIMRHATVYGSVICLHRESRACCMRPRDRDTRTRRLKVVVSAVARHPLLLSAQPPHGALWGGRAPPSQCSAQRALSASFTVPSAARAEKARRSRRRAQGPRSSLYKK